MTSVPPPLQADRTQQSDALQKSCFYRCIDTIADYFECDRAVEISELPASYLYNKKNKIYWEDFDESYTERQQRLARKSQKHKSQQQGMGFEESEKLAVPTDRERFMKCLSLSWWIDFLCCAESDELREQEGLMTTENNDKLDASEISIHDGEDKYGSKLFQSKHNEDMNGSLAKLNGYHDEKVDYGLTKSYDVNNDISDFKQKNELEEPTRKLRGSKLRTNIKTTNEVKNDGMLNVQQDKQTRDRMGSVQIVNLQNKEVRIENNKFDEEQEIDIEDSDQVVADQARKNQPARPVAYNNSTAQSKNSYYVNDNQGQGYYEEPQTNQVPLIYDRTIVPQEQIMRTSNNYQTTISNKQETNQSIHEDQNSGSKGYNTQNTNKHESNLQLHSTPNYNTDSEHTYKQQPLNYNSDNYDAYHNNKDNNNGYIQDNSSNVHSYYDDSAQREQPDNNNIYTFDSNQQQEENSRAYDVRKRRKNFMRRDQQPQDETIQEAVVQEEEVNYKPAPRDKLKKKKKMGQERIVEPQAELMEEAIEYTEEY